MTLNTEERQVIDLITHDPNYARYFFSKVKNLKWFASLEVAGFFKPSTVPIDTNGNASFWLVLDYLERVSEQLNENPQFGTKLLDIIENTVNYSLNERQLIHHHIWWYFVKILNNIPTQILSENLKIDDTSFNGKTKYGLKTWLTVFTNPIFVNDLSISDIGMKLLGHFLSDPETLKHAEVAIDCITQIKKDTGKNLLFRKEAKLRWHSYWVSQALKKYHKIIGSQCSPDTVFLIANRLNDALQYNHETYQIRIRNKETVYELILGRIPLENLKEDELGYKNNCYSVTIKQFSDKQIEGKDLSENYLGLYKVEPEIEHAKFQFEAKNREELLKGIIEGIKRCFPIGNLLEDPSNSIEKLSYLTEGIDHDLSYIWCKSLAAFGNEHGSDAHEILTPVLRDILLVKQESNSEVAKLILMKFLSGSYRFSIFRRMALLCVDRLWDDKLLNEFFETIPNALGKEDYEVELYNIFLHHNNKFDNELKQKIGEMLNKIPEYYDTDEKHIAHWKFKWLSALKDNPTYAQDYEKVKNTVSPKNGKPYEPRESSFEGGIIVHRSPLNVEEIINMPVFEFIRFTSEYKSADFFSAAFEGKADRDGLLNSFREAVKRDPAKFTNDIKLLQNAPHDFVVELINGLSDSWKNGKDIAWEKIFDFLATYLKHGEKIFQMEHPLTNTPGVNIIYNRFIAALADLLIEGCKNDSHSIDIRYSDKVHAIFSLVLPLLRCAEKPDFQRDALTYSYNTTFGRIILAYIEFTLHIARVTERKQTVWKQEIFDHFLKVGIDAYILLGCFLLQFHFLDSSYVEKKVKELSEQSNDDFKWQAFMEGYLAGCSLNRTSYYLMRPNYLKALNCQEPFLGERIDERLVHHISDGFLGGLELLKEKNEDGQESLFWKMLNEVTSPIKRGRWLKIADFFWVKRSIRKDEANEKEEKILPEVKKRILEFWKWTYDEQNFVRAKLEDEYLLFLGRLSLLTALLDKIDGETEKWLLLSAPHAEKNYSSGFFLEYLTKFEDTESVRVIGKIFRAVLENATPTFREEDIKQIVLRICEKGDKNDAKEIINTYGRRGVHFLKNLYDKC